MTAPAADLGEALAERTLALCRIPSPIGSEREICDVVERWARARFPSVRRVKDSLVIRPDPPSPLTPTLSPLRGEREKTGPLVPTFSPSPPAVAGYAEPRARTLSNPPSPPAVAGYAEPRAPTLSNPPSPPAVAGGEGRGEGGRPLIALCGHLDTIPVHEEDRGRAPRREGGRIVSPGATDMKGGLAVMMELAERVPREARFADLLLVLYAREEGPYLENELEDVLREAPEVSAASLAVCLEPTDNVLQLGCVGSIHATLTFTGRSAHSARPWQGENAVHRAGALLQELSARAPREALSDGLVYREVVSVTRIEGGRARNVVPDRCTLNLNFRFAPDRTLEAAADEVRALASRFGAEVTLTDLSPACPSFAGHPLVRRLAERAGLPAEPKQAWTDVARLAAHGIPAVNLGPGATSQAHQRGEWVEVDALVRCHRTLEAFLRV